MSNSNEHNGIKIGDIITTYYSGFYKLIKIERRYLTERDVNQYSIYKDKKVGDEYSPIFVFTKVADAKGNFTKSKNTKVQSCDALHCMLASIYIANQLKELNEIMARLQKLQVYIF